VLEHVLFSRLDVTMYAETCILLGRDMRHQQVKMPRGAVMYYRANLFLFSQSVCVCVCVCVCVYTLSLAIFIHYDICSVRAQIILLLFLLLCLLTFGVFLKTVIKRF
jgi:hypothetical protein